MVKAAGCGSAIRRFKSGHSPKKELFTRKIKKIKLNDFVTTLCHEMIHVKQYARKEINGVELRRAYSISSVPATNKITVGVKKVTDGIFSVYANEKIKVGDVLEVMPPEGRFVFEPTNSAKHVAAFVAGSGITPILSMMKTSNSSFTLIYGNKTIESTVAEFEQTFRDGDEDWKILEKGLNQKTIIGVNHYELFSDIKEEWKLIHKNGLKALKE